MLTICNVAVSSTGRYTLERAGVLCSYRQLFGLSWDSSVDSLSQSWTSNSNLSVRLSSYEVSGIFVRF